MAHDDPVQHVWEMIKDLRICMLVTHDGAKMRARPMAAYVRPEENAIYFLTDARRDKDDEIAANPDVTLTFRDGVKNVSLTGTARVSDDRAMIERLWTPVAKAWFDSKDDPNIRVLTVTPDDAEYWDSPGKIVVYAKMLAAAATGMRPQPGENRKVAM
ncbi:MAG TPA: pyridoxamine 5'-phosphate oxidase family protein [Rhizomicrobium sp.]|jgi:general stress protein 26|nr:pyridoxamine 5'-phosphate oxidase family protein [Rhizomicrobium sp.]